MTLSMYSHIKQESNIILHSTYEYRFPTSSQLAAAAAAVTSSLPSSSSAATTTITSSSALSAPSAGPPNLDPPAPQVSAPSAPSESSISTTPQELEEAYDKAAATGKVKVDLSSRYLGLVVIPGQYITKIELEEFASQVRARKLHPGWRDAMAGGIS